MVLQPVFQFAVENPPTPFIKGETQILKNYYQEANHGMKSNDSALSRRLFLPYNPALKERAREMRKKPTIAERRMWELLTQDKILKQFRFLRQKPINQYIVDFGIMEK